MGILSLASIILLAGFYLPEDIIEMTRLVINVVLVIYILQEAASWFTAHHFREHIKERLFRNFLALLLLLSLLFPDDFFRIFSGLLPQLTIRQITLIYLSIIQFPIIFVIIIKLLRKNYLINKLRLQPGAIFGLSFAIIIIGGALLLLLPKATPPGQGISVLDSLFTSTSAVCVTGLTVVDTAANFAPLGKLIILILIQIGGLGVMTLTTFFAAFLAGGISYRIRIMMQDLLSQESLSEVAGILIKIITYTLIIEIVGAFFLYLSLGGSVHEVNWDYIYSSVFHSVSAFCNAGFSLYSSGLMEDTVLTNFGFSSTIMILIVLGGLGFTVLSNLAGIRPRKFKLKRVRYQISPATKIVLYSTVILLIAGGVLMYFSENFSYAPDMSFGEKLYHSLFLSVTARTAGFNTVPIDGLAAPTVLIMLFLMWIGASPGSTGGGIKTTTAAISFLSFSNIVRGRERLEIFGRTIDPESIRKAFVLIFSSLMALGASSILLVWIEPDKAPLDLIFEATSAISTVGLSRNITPHLSAASKIIIILLMFIGRIGVFTFFISFFKSKPEPEYKLPKSSIMIG